MKAFIKSIEKSSLCVTITATFKGMRHEKEFVVYNKSVIYKGGVIIQSDTRIGYYDKANKEIRLCKPVSSGAYFHHLSIADAYNNWVVTKLTDEEIEWLNEYI